MKAATGELNLTVITVIAIGAVIAFFWAFFPTIKNSISNIWSDVGNRNTIGSGGGRDVAGGA